MGKEDNARSKGFDLLQVEAGQLPTPPPTLCLRVALTHKPWETLPQLGHTT